MDRITFPEYTGVRCLMMPFIQGDSSSLPEGYQPYSDIIDNLYLKKGDVGYLTIDESVVNAGKPHRGERAKHGRALHTEAGIDPNKIYCWGSGNGGGWGRSHKVTLDRDVRILLANSIDNSCAIWDAEHPNTSIDGDIGQFADQYPMSNAKLLKAGEVANIGILTPHESLPIEKESKRQFIRIVSSGVHGREDYFTRNPLIKH